jgi:hypothetical protein
VLISLYGMLSCLELCKNSAIMRDERELVKALIGLVDKNFTWTLCYRASRDNWKGQDFHNLCDTKSPTVILVKVGVNIFGGYADQNWQGKCLYHTNSTVKCLSQ